MYTNQSFVAMRRRAGPQTSSPRTRYLDNWSISHTREKEHNGSNITSNSKYVHYPTPFIHHTFAGITPLGSAYGSRRGHIPEQDPVSPFFRKPSLLFFLAITLCINWGCLKVFAKLDISYGDAQRWLTVVESSLLGRIECAGFASGDGICTFSDDTCQIRFCVELEPSKMTGSYRDAGKRNSSHSQLTRWSSCLNNTLIFTPHHD